MFLRKIIDFFSPKQMRVYDYEVFDENRDYFKTQIDRTILKQNSLSVGEGYKKDYATKQSRIDALAQLLPMSSIHHALAIGCRNPTELDILERHGVKNVTGIDLISSDRRIKICDMHHIDFAKDKTFDLIYASHSLEHARAPKRVFQEIMRVTTDDAWIFFEVPVNFPPAGADLHDFKSARNILSLLESVYFGKLSVIQAQDIGLEQSLVGTSISRLLVRKYG